MLGQPTNIVFQSPFCERRFATEFKCLRSWLLVASTSQCVIQYGYLFIYWHRWEMLCFVIAILVLADGVASGIISRVLPPLVVRQKIYPAEVYTTNSKQQFTYTFGEAHNSQISISSLDPTLVAEDECAFLGWSADLTHKSTHPVAWEEQHTDQFLSQVFIPSKRLLYTVSFGLLVSVYTYKLDGTLRKQTSLKLGDGKETGTNLRPYMIGSDNGSVVFVFAPGNDNKVWRIHSEYLLSKIQVQVLESFDSDKPFRKAVAYKDHIYIALDTGGLVNFKIDSSNALQLVQVQNLVGAKKIFPVSLEVSCESNLLFVLDSRQNIYVYNITSGSLQLFDTILFSHPQNIQIHVHNNLVYSSFYDGQFAIKELFYNTTTKVATFVRYYTSREYISDFNVEDGYLLLLASRNLDIFPTNLDPRLIKKEHNGVHKTMKGDKILRLGKNQFLFVDKHVMNVYQVGIRTPTLVCKPNGRSIFLNVIYTGVSKVCDQESKTNTPFYHACNFTRTMRIELIEPKETHQNKIAFYIAISVLLAILVLGLCCLKFWRDNRIRQIRLLQSKIEWMINDSVNVGESSLSVNIELQAEGGTGQAPKKRPGDYNQFQQSRSGNSDKITAELEEDTVVEQFPG